MKMAADPKTRQSWESLYRATTYRIFLPSGAVTARIGETPPPALAAYAPWAIVTACNPASRLLTASQNARRQALLASALTAGGWAFHAGENIADDGRWPAEPTFFIPGIARPDAVALGRQFGQNAIVHGHATHSPDLLWVEKEPP